jgi:hypothetical protein
MATFRAGADMRVALQDEGGKRLGVAQFRIGQWTAPSDAQAEAMRRLLPGLARYGIKEIAGPAVETGGAQEGVARNAPAEHEIAPAPAAPDETPDETPDVEPAPAVHKAAPGHHAGKKATG